MISPHKKLKLYYGFLLFLYIYGAFDLGLGFVSVNYVKIVAGLIFAETIYYMLWRVNSLVVKMFITMGVLWIYSSLVTNYYEVFDNSFSDLIKVLMVESILVGYYFAKILKMRKYTDWDILNLFADVLFFQSLIITAMAVSPAIREFVWTHFNSDGRKEFLFTGRGLGLSSHLFFDFALVQSLFFIIKTFQLIQKRKFTLFDYFKTIIVFFSIMYTARTALVGVGASIVLAIFFSENKWKSIWNFFRISILTFIIINVSMVILPKSLTNLLEYRIFPWFFEWYYNFLDTGSISTGSSNYLFEHMYYWPDSEILFFGTGFYQNFFHFVGLTDAGYMRQILYFGVVGSLIVWYYYIRFMGYNLYITRKLSTLNFFTLIFLFLMFLVHVKGDILIQSTINIRPLHFMFFSSLLIGSKTLK